MFESLQQQSYSLYGLSQVKSFLDSGKKYLPYIGLVFGLIGSIVSIGIFFFSENQSIQPSISSSGTVVFKQEESIQNTTTLTIYISGAVEHPGVYSVSAGSSVADAIKVSGGLSPVADYAYIEESINLAAVLTDRMHIFIPRNESMVSAPRANTQSSPIHTLVSINSASSAELEGLPKIGEKTAAKIIAGRPYTTIDQILTKKYVSESVFTEIKGKLSL